MNNSRFKRWAYTALCIMVSVSVGLPWMSWSTVEANATDPTAYVWDNDAKLSELTVDNAANVTIANGILSGSSANNDPRIWSPASMAVRAEAFTKISVRMKLTPGDHVSQLFWSADNDAMGEKTSLKFNPIADGQMHEYVFYMGDNEFWHGVITRLRLDPSNKPDAGFELDYLKLEPAGADLAATLGRSSLIVTPSNTFQVYMQLENRGDAVAAGISATLSLPAGLSLANGSDPTQTSADIAPHEMKTLAWDVTGAAGHYEVSVNVSGSNIAARSLQTNIVVTDIDASSTERSVETPSVYTTANGSVVMENTNNRLVFVKDATGFVGYRVEVWNGSQWYTLAATMPFSRLQYEDGGLQEKALIPSVHTVNRPAPDAAEAVFDGSFTDAGGATWTYQMKFAMNRNEPDTTVTYTLSPNQDRGIYRYEGPILRAGDGTFGRGKKDAIFPGLEWLEGEEVSSAKGIDFKNHHAERVVPMYHKITTPVMAVANGSYVVSLDWDPQQAWHGASVVPSAQFSMPNRLEAMDNSQMGLFLPSTYDGKVRENELRAATAYAVQANTVLQLVSNIYVGDTAESGAIDALSHYYRKNSPDLLPAIRSNEQSIELSKEALMSSLWDEEKMGWTFNLNTNLAPRYDVYPYPDRIMALYRYSLHTADASSRTAARARIDDARTALDTRYGSAAYGLELPFYVGGFQEAWMEQEYQMEAIIASQKEDGNWPYAGDILYGEPGSSVMGVTANTASQVLAYARITGSREALESGLRGVHAANAFLVPRGAQSWESGVHSPDVLAAARAIVANVIAFELTHEEVYRDNAVLWAKKGLPFLYSWQAANKNEAMKFSTTPLFASSWYWRSWLGEPVPWNALDYGDALRRIAQYDNSLEWNTIAEGIWRSVARTINTDAQAYGTFPDIYFLSADNWGAPWINPVRTLNAAFWSDGFAYGRVNFAGVRDGTRDYYVNSSASISGAVLDTDNSLSAVLQYPGSETSHTTIAGVMKPSAVLKDGSPLGYHDNLDAVAEGWSYSPDVAGTVIIKTLHGSAPVAIRIDDCRPSPEWAFDRPGDTESWTAHGQVGSLSAAGNQLVVTPNGDNPGIAKSVNLLASDYTKLDIRYTVGRGNGKLLKVSWRAAGEAWSDAKSVQARIRDNGKPSRTIVDLGNVTSWTGEIDELKLEWPDTKSGQPIAIDRIRLIRTLVEKQAETEWDFNAGTEGWTTGNGIAGAAAANGSLTGTSTTNDPYYFSPNLFTPSVPILQMRMKSSAGGTNEVYYSLPAPYGHYAADRKSAFAIRGTDRFYDYTVNLSALTANPNKWTMDLMQQVKALRLDPVNSAGASFEIDYVGLLNEPDQQYYHKLWTFDAGTEGWTAAGGFEAPVQTDDGGVRSLRASVTGSDPTLESAVGAIETKYKYIILRLKSSGATKARFQWSYDSGIYTSERAQEIELIPDNQYHVYVIKASHNTEEWRGTVNRIALSFPGAPLSSDIHVDYIKVGEFPEQTNDWTWSVDNDAEGWGGTHSLTGLTVSEGLLAATVSGTDPYMKSPGISVSASQYPVLRIRTAVSAGDYAELYWTTDTDPAWSQSKRIRFSVVPDGKLRTYEVYLADNKLWKDNVTQLRLDLGDNTAGTSIKLDYVRLIADKQRYIPLLWDFANNGSYKGWSAPGQFNGLTNPSYGGNGLTWTLSGTDPYFRGPLADIDASDYDQVRIVMQTPAGNGNTARLYWLNKGGSWNESDSVDFSIRTDGNEQEYIIDLREADGWSGIVNQLRLDPIQNPGSAAGTIVIKEIALVRSSK